MTNYDEMVAEKVMGWTIHQVQSGGYPRMWVDEAGVLTGWALDQWPPGSGDPYSDNYAGDAPIVFTPNGIFEPTTKIAAAMQAYDAIKDKWNIEIGHADVTEPIAGFKVGWYVLMWPRNIELKSEDCPEAYSEDNLPLAICLAALKAVNDETTHSHNE
jgi:hypothetical protein